MPHLDPSVASYLFERYDVVLASSYSRATSINSDLAAQSPAGAFGKIATTFSSWIADAWELGGNGCAIASSCQSTMAMSEAILSYRGQYLENRPNLPIAAARCYGKAAGLPQLDDALAGALPDGLLPAEKALLECFASYREALASLGLIEQGDAISYLAHHAAEAFPLPIRVCLLSNAPLPPLQAWFFDACARAGVLDFVQLSDEGQALAAPVMPVPARAPEGISLRFAFPSGSYAQPQLLLQIIDEVKADGTVVISARDPLSLYAAMAPSLAERGIRCAATGRKLFSQTEFGSAFLSLFSCIQTDDVLWDRAALADVAASPLMRRQLDAVWRWDARIRGNRQTRRTQAIEAFAQKSELFALLLSLVASPSPAAFSAAEDAFCAVGAYPECAAFENKAVLDALKELFLTARKFGVEAQQETASYCALLANASISVKYGNFERAAGAAPEVIIEDMRRASDVVPGSCSTLVVCDLDSTSYPASVKDDAMAIMLKKLGVPSGEDYLTQQRRIWSGLVAAPCKHLIVGRCLNDEKADPRYPCALLEEFVDCYRADPTQIDDIDNEFAIPEVLQKGISVPCGGTEMFTLGEEDLQGDVAPEIKRAQMEDSQASMGQAEARVRTANAHAQAGLDAGGQPGVQPEQLCLSPSQMEAYLACPRFWFLTRRLKTDPLDEGFGPLELGTYHHDVLLRFYQEFIKAGGGKVSNKNMPLAKEVMERVLDEVEREHAALDENGNPVVGRGRCVPLAGTTEYRSLETAKDELRAWLEFERGFLPVPAPGTSSVEQANACFLPADFEVDLEGYAIGYAGCRLIGRIDRVDVSPSSGRAVVVDYKGNMGTDYGYDKKKDAKGYTLSKKIQALVYASAIEKSSDLARRLGAIRHDSVPVVAGALYVSYKRGNELRGVYSCDGISHDEGIPQIGSTNKGLSDDDFKSLLADLEEKIAAEVVDRIALGDVEPRLRDTSRSKAPCKNCPDVSCPRRNA